MALASVRGMPHTLIDVVYLLVWAFLAAVVLFVLLLPFLGGLPWWSPAEPRFEIWEDPRLRPWWC